MSPEPLSAEMPDLNAIADQLLQTARVTEIRSQSDPLWVNDRVAALKRALAPEVEDLIFADGDIIAWRMPEMMTTETVHRTVVYSACADEWFWGDGSSAGEWRDIIQKLMAEEVIDVSFIPASARLAVV